jgi:hypothetical protein
MDQCHIEILDSQLIFLDLRIICEYGFQLIGETVLGNSHSLGVLGGIEFPLGVFLALGRLDKARVEVGSQVHEFLLNAIGKRLDYRATVVVDLVCRKVKQQLVDRSVVALLLQQLNEVFAQLPLLLLLRRLVDTIQERHVNLYRRNRQLVHVRVTLLG